MKKIGTVRCPMGARLDVEMTMDAKKEKSHKVKAKDSSGQCPNICDAFDDPAKPGLVVVSCPVHGQIEANASFWKSEVKP